MQCLWSNAKKKEINDCLKVYEMCHDKRNLSMDGAIAELNGVFGPKINKTFTELFFVISGKLVIEEDDKSYELKERDMYIVLPGKTHTLHGINCSMFISCTPPFDPLNMEILSD
jgi:mannose-6-phosphate isomerase-like protein (cupin superfamily)